MTGLGEPPDPTCARTVAELIDRLRALRSWTGWSYRVVHREVTRDRRARGVPEQRRTFRLLALHPGGDIGVHAAAALTGLSVETVGHHLDQLRMANLVQGKNRWAFHDLIRIHAADRVRDEEPARARRAALLRLLAYYEHTASLAMDALPDKAAMWLESERENLIAVARHAAENGCPAHTRRQADTLMHFLDLSGHYRDALVLQPLAL